MTSIRPERDLLSRKNQNQRMFNHQHLLPNLVMTRYSSVRPEHPRLRGYRVPQLRMSPLLPVLATEKFFVVLTSHSFRVISYPS